jgi:3alpha(or 20beta)-hydroxysteroid dehydrogenase
MKGRLDGKVALVTGAARGTGETVARRFVAEGARVALADVLDERGHEVARGLGGAACYCPLDVSSEGDWARGVEATLDRFGRIDVLVNNAAVLYMAAIADTSVDDFLRVVRVNQLGTFLGIRSVIEPMKAAGGGSIVNVSSVDGLRGQNGIVAYAASKWAVRGITRVAALELGRFGIRVNAVCPEAGSPFMIQPYMPPGVEIERLIPRMQPHLAYQKERTLDELMADVANVILFLASDESRSCTGSDFACEGGNLAGRVVKGAPGA